MSGELHVLLHPTFQVPCPYLRLWDQAGNTLSLEDTQFVVDGLTRSRDGIVSSAEKLSGDGLQSDDGNDISGGGSSSSTISDKATDVDSRRYAFGSLMSESHPYLDTPCCTVYVCTLPVRMTALMCGQPLELYMINWWALIGPSVGIVLDKEFYCKFVDCIV
jgi:hypothetical protein